MASIDEKLRKFRADFEKFRPEWERQSRAIAEANRDLKKLDFIMGIITTAREDKHLLN